jgi:hypothetical protein
MQSKILHANRDIISNRFWFLLVILFLTSVSLNAQSYFNGNLGTGTVNKAGVAAPAGFQFHEMMNNIGNNTVANASLAFNASGVFTAADNFTVPVGQTWTISGMSFYTIQTAASVPTAVGVAIRNGSPLAGGTVIAGNLATNVYNSSVPTNVNVITSSANPTVAPFASTLNVTEIRTLFSTAVVLTAGTYWVEWNITSPTPSFNVFSQVFGSRTQPSYNALQKNGTAAYAALVDNGTPAGSPVPVDLCFKINYTSVGGTACSGVPAPGATLSSVTSSCPGLPFNLSLASATAGTGVTYQWQSGTSSTGPWTNIVGAQDSTLRYSLSATTFYRCNVTCGANTTASTPVSVALATSCYCIPTATNCNLSDVITNVTFGGINNTSACAANGYTDYTTNTAVPVGQAFFGVANPMSVTVGPGGTEYVGVWIDYNKDGTFAATEFTALGSGNGVTINGTINIPASALPGNTRMRVRVQWNAPVTATMACAQSSTFGEVEDYTVNLQQCVPVTATTPANVSAACQSTATFTVPTTGSLPTYQWQFLATGSTTWQVVTATSLPGVVITGMSAASLNLATIIPAYDGYQFRCLVGGVCTAQSTTGAAKLTVTPLVAAISPVTTSICKGSGAITALSIQNPGLPAQTTVTFNSATLNTAILEDGTGVTNVLNVSGLPNGGVITNIRVIPTISHTWVGDIIMALKAPNGSVLNLSYALNGTNNNGTGFAGTRINFANNPNTSLPYPFLSTGAGVYNNIFRPDARTAATATPLNNGLNSAVRPTGPAGFTATTALVSDLYGSTTSANGGWTLALYDFYDDGANGGIVNRLTSWSIEITYAAPDFWTSTPASPNTMFTDAAATIPYVVGTLANTIYVKPDTTTTYTASINRGGCSAQGTSVVNVNPAPTGTLAVTNTPACIGRPVNITVTGAVGTGLTYQWQVSTDNGSNYSNISGATASTYVIASATATMTGNRYRVLVGSAGCTAQLTSPAVTLTVNPIPTVNLGFGPTLALTPGETTTLSSAVAPSGQTPVTYQWSLNGTPIPGATAATQVATINSLGNYTLAVVAAGCSASVITPSSLTVVDTASSKLFIYPNPTVNGQFEVRYYNDQTNRFVTPESVNVYDGQGRRVFTQRYAITSGYTRMLVNLGAGVGKGVYHVDVITTQGDRLATGSVIVN